MRCARIHYVGHLIAGIVVLLGVRVLAPRVPSIRTLCWIRTATEWVQVDTQGKMHENILVGIVSPSLLSLKSYQSIQVPGELNVDKKPTLIAASLSLAMV
jgi:hypothetical protein